MKRFGIFYLMSAVLFLAFSVQRSADSGQRTASNDPCQAISLALHYTKGDLKTYRVITENQRQALWEGPISQRPEGFVGGRTSSRVEVTFDQLVQTVKDKGSAILRIKITGIKCYSVIRDNATLDFDSVKNKDPNRPLAKLLGSSYTIEVSPFGQVLKIIDVNNVRTGFITATTENQMADKLLSDSTIKERHTITALVSSGQSQLLYKGQSWSVPESISFDLMGTKNYEKTYTLEGMVKEKDGREIAVVKMSAATSPQQTTGPLSIDTKGAYTGLLRLEPKTGTIEQNREELATEWVVQAGIDTPDTLRISATRLYSCEKIIR